MASEAPVLDTITAMTLESVERCGLDPHALLLVREPGSVVMPSRVGVCRNRLRSASISPIVASDVDDPRTGEGGPDGTTR